MMNKTLLLLLFAPFIARAQTNVLCTNPFAEQVLTGNYDPAPFAAVTPLDPLALAHEIDAAVSPDSLKALIIRMSAFHNRNSGSDTLSATVGIGAARRWVMDQFDAFSAVNGHRLVNTYLQFDQAICGVDQHKNILAILPGADPASGVILVEGHIDSRCAGLCDTACVAEGVEDNASGAALVMELARVLSRWQFANTIVFMVTTAEEQGLYGAQAFGNYCQDKAVPLRAVLNNDVIGGIICGKTSSPPSCPGLNDIDSTGVRLFSLGSFNSRHKQLARFIKLEYLENLKPYVSVPMDVRIMAPEDRTGRSGDHIPFRQRGYPAMRFTAANEHGDASNTSGYTDRQHTASDVLGVDTDLDGMVDSFFVDFHYLARNAVINANAAVIAARNVAPAPDFTAIRSADKLILHFNNPIDSQTVRVALRSVSNDWDTVYTLSPTHSDELYCNATGSLFVSVAGVDQYGAESLFSAEKNVGISATTNPEAKGESNFRLLQNKPNPFDEATWITFYVKEVPPGISSAFIQISDAGGAVLQHIPVTLQPGINETLYTHGYGKTGTLSCTLVVNGKIVDTRQMIFAN